MQSTVVILAPLALKENSIFRHNFRNFSLKVSESTHHCFVISNLLTIAVIEDMLFLLPLVKNSGEH